MDNLTDKLADAITSASNDVIEVNIDSEARSATIRINREAVKAVISEVIQNSDEFCKKTSGWLFYFVNYYPDNKSFIDNKDIIEKPKYVYAVSDKRPKKICKHDPLSGPFAESTVTYYTVFVPNTERTFEDKHSAKDRAINTFEKARKDNKLPKRSQEELGK